MQGFLQLLKRALCFRGEDHTDRHTATPNVSLSRAPPPPPPQQSLEEVGVIDQIGGVGSGKSSKGKRPKRPKSSSSSQDQSSSSCDRRSGDSKVWVQKGTNNGSPEDFRDLIKKDIIPHVLKMPLCPLTYRCYFASLLFAEYHYVEKWSDCCLSSVTLELHKRYSNSIEGNEGKDTYLAAFEIDKISNKLPFLLPGDVVRVKRAGMNVKPFQGNINRVLQSNVALADFGDDFHSQHSPDCRYDISFSLDTFCLKRCYEAVIAAMDPLFQDFLFPNPTTTINFFLPPYPIPPYPNLDNVQAFAVYHISRLKTTPPYLIEGPPSVIRSRNLSRTGYVIQQAVLQVCRMSPRCRILINAPRNNICDVLMRSLLNEMPQSEIFRANAAFRELDGVPSDILPLCPIKGGHFSFPSLQELQNFKVILSTFVSSLRLHNEGIHAGHFTHIFLVDASSATEPETMISLANFATGNTIVVASGSSTDFPIRVRSDIARGNGLMVSYFQRLLESEPYCSLDPMFVTSISKGRQCGYGFVQG